MINLRAVRVWLAVVAASAMLGGGVARAQSAVPESQLEVFLGLQQGDLTGLNNGPVMNGSAIMQTITVVGREHPVVRLRLPDQPAAAGHQPADRTESLRLRHATDPDGFR